MLTMHTSFGTLIFYSGWPAMVAGERFNKHRSHLSGFPPSAVAPPQNGTSPLLRQYFPKGTDLSTHSPQRLLEVANELDDRPRKTLGGSTPTQAMQRLLFEPEEPSVATTA